MNKIRFKKAKLLLYSSVAVMLFLLVVNSKAAYAQGMVNITVTGIPAVIDDPFVDRFEQNFRNGRYQLIFTYNNNNPAPVEFRFKFKLTRGGREVLEVVSEPKSFRPGAYVFTSIFDELPFRQSFEEVMDQIESKIKMQIVQEGTIPEGSYLLNIKAIPESEPGIIVSPQSITPFTVRYPNPPILINPSDEANLTLVTPVFNWTPVAGMPGYPIQYDFLLVEVLNNQTPLQAINSNRAHAERSLVDRNTLIYTPEFLPLEEGKQYAWQVLVRSVNGLLPIRNSGKSEVHTFIYKKGISDEAIADVRNLESIPLIPGFAKLVGFDRLEATDAGNSLVLNGYATLELDFTGNETREVRVQVNNLRLQKRSLTSPVLMGGMIRGEAGHIAPIPGNSNKFVKLDEILWQFGEGVTATAELSAYGDDLYQAEGALTLSAEGARGTLRVTGSPLMTFSEGMAEVEINEIEAAFPQGTIIGKGSIRLMGSETGCEVNSFTFLDDRISTIVYCNSPFSLPLVENSNMAAMSIDKIKGMIDVYPQENSLEYTLDLNSTVGLLTEEGEVCGTDALISLDSGAGIQIQPGENRCRGIQPRLDLGFIQLELTQMQLESLAYDPSTEDWDFELNLGAEINIPAFDSWSSAKIEDILVDDQGIHFDEIVFEDGPLPLPDYNINDFRVQLKSLLLRDFTFPLFEWDKAGPGPWDISFSGEVTVPYSGYFPECLRGLTLGLTGGRVEDSGVFGEVDTSNFPGCSVDFGSGHSLNIEEVAGRFGAEYLDDGSLEPVGRLELGGSMEFGRPFLCETAGSVPLGEKMISISTGLNGVLNDVVPKCDVALGPFTVRVTDSDIHFSHSAGSGQTALMQASAELELPDGQLVQGTFDLDLISDTFKNVSFNINDPFEWNIPQNDPVLTFQINNAQINEQGFFVNGRQQFLLESGKQIGTTFDNLLVDLETLHIKQGRVIFDESFAVVAGIDPDERSLNFSVAEIGAELTEDPGLYMELGGQVVIDSAGVHADGHAEALVSFNGQEYNEQTTVEFSEEFSFQLFPFKIGSGRADFLLNGTRFAYADPDGFHPEIGFFADLLVPEILPLPSKDVAYIRLRDGDELLVDATRNEDGNYVLSTRADTPLSLVAPFLNEASPPVLSNITLNNVVISSNPTNPEILEGAIVAEVPVNNPVFQLKDRNVPLTLRKLYFGSRSVSGTPITALYLLGDLHLFDNDLLHEQEAEFYIQSDGAVQARLNLSGMNARIPLLPGNQASLLVEAVSGSFSLPAGATVPNYDIQVDGGLEIDTESGFSTGADLGIRITPGDFTVTNFNARTFESVPEIDFGIFGLKLNSIESLPVFKYTRQSGFDFAIALNVDLGIQPVTGDEIVFPLQGLEIRSNGIHLPIQHINQSSIPGLDLPEFTLAGFTFKPLTLKTSSAFTFNWSEGMEFNPDINMSFEVQLPEFEGTGLNPPDGLTFKNVSLDGGFLIGSVDPFQPLGGAEIPLIPGMPDSPTLIINEIFGSLSRNQDEQVVDIQVDGELGSLPAFTVDNPDMCTNNPSFTLSLVESRYFEGSVSNIRPCGYLTLGPAKLSVTSADLNFSVSENSQHAELDGGVELSLPAPGNGSPITANGALIVDLITGDISDGTVTINQPFALNLPFGSEDPLLNFTVNQAQLDKEGLLIQGGGSLAADGVQANVQFNNLQMGFAPFAVIGGSASIASDFGVEIGVAPLSLKLKDPAKTLSLNNGIDMDITGTLELNSGGLAIGGSSTARILYGGEEYASLRADLLNGFTLDLSGLGVSGGRAEFYDESNGQEDLIAVLDENGFNPLAGLTALLPARLPLPTEDIAYVDIKDQNDNLLVDITENEDNGGYTIATKEGEILSVVIPGLPDQSGNPMQVDVEFSLTADGAYNITGGSLFLESPTSLKSSLNLPLSLTQLEIMDDGGLKLKAGLKIDLPGVLQEHDVLAKATITSGGIESGSITLGNHRSSYQPGLTPLYTYSHSGTVSGSDETDVFEASLLGVEAVFGNDNSIVLSGTVSSSLIMNVDEGDEPVFFLASWSDTGWGFELDPGNKIEEMMMGEVTLSPDDHEGIGLQADDNSFYLVLNGTVSMEDILGEPLDITVQGLEVGIDNLSSSPSMHFALGSAAGNLSDQTFTLFNGALAGVIEDPSVTLNGRAVGLSSSSGTLTFLEKDISYQNLILDTDGNFGFDEIQSGEIALIEDHLILKSMTLTTNNGLRLESELEVTLPAPVNQTSTTTITIYRDDQNQVQVETTDPAFDLNHEFALGEFGHFKLTKIAANIDPYNWQQSGIYANGELYKTGGTDPILYFGESANFPDNPGLGFSPGQSPMVQYNVTGNVSFLFDFSIFAVTVGFDKIAATQDGFEIVLNGTADINLDQMEANLGYRGFTINQNGVADTGNLDGTGSIDMSGIGTLTIGQFIYEENPNGKEIILADTSPRGPEELDGSSEGGSETTKNVVELLCFGPCPVDTGTDTLGTNSALKLSISAGANNESGGFSGEVHSIFFYETLSGEQELYIEDFNVSIDEFFTMNANLNWMKDGNDYLLRAAASGSFDIGGVSAGAVIAGKFANIGGVTSYGLFVAAEAEPGIPIVPGIIDLNGAGGGFFWKPEQEDLDMVAGALAGFGYELVNSDAVSIADGTDFAVMLYANMGIAGAAGQYMIEGKTFLQITNQSFYMDARGNVLQMDGEGIASALVEGSMYIAMQRDPFYILGGIGIALKVPGAVTGNGNIEYFLREVDNNTVWGIIGNADFSIVGGILEGDGEFLAAQQGFLLEVGVGFNVGIPVLSVKSDLTGSIWLLDDPDFSLPFGAYVVFNAEACLGICISAHAKGAFVTKSPSGFEIFAAVKGCIDLLIDEACLAAWASLADDGIDAGFGEGSHNDLIAQARAQRDQFRQKIEDMKNQIAAAKEALKEPPEFSGFAYSGEDVRKAGANFYAQSLHRREAAFSEILDDVETDYKGPPYSLPSQFQPLINNVMLAERPHNSVDAYAPLSPAHARVDLNNAIRVAHNLSDQVSGLLTEGVETSIEFRESAEGAFDDMLATMSQSPVSSVIRPIPSANVTESPSFVVDETAAVNQVDNTAELRGEIQRLDQQFRDNIAAVETSLNQMHTLLDAQVEPAASPNSKDTITPSVNTLTNHYAHVLTLMKKYYALEANKRWLEWGWAKNLRSTVHQYSSQIQSGIQNLNNGFYNALANRNDNSIAYDIEAYRAAQRNHVILRFSDSLFLGNIYGPNNSSTPQEIQTVYNELKDPNCPGSSLDCIRDQVEGLNTDFWYNMHDLGLREYASQTSRRVSNEVVPAQRELQSSLLSAHKNVTGLIDEFYTNKANLTSILYNMIDNYIRWRQSMEVESDGAGTGQIVTLDNTIEQYVELQPGSVVGVYEVVSGSNADGEGSSGEEIVAPVNYSQRLQELSNELVPPQITSITVDPSRSSAYNLEGFFNRTDISWDATHPVEVVEYSVDIKQYEDDTDISVGYHDYLSVGDKASLTVYPYKRAHPRGDNPSQEAIQFYNTQQMNIGVRARGYAGNTAIRRATFNVDVGPGGQTVSSGSSVLPDNASPPEGPMLWLSAFYEKSTSTRYEWATIQTLYGSRRMYSPIEVDEYWTNEPATIQLLIQAHDSETGIATYEYAVGTTQGGTDVIEWTELQGTREFLSYVPTSQMTGETRMINMISGQDYYVSVRVTNGAGLRSQVTESSTPVIYDDEAPTKPNPQYVIQLYYPTMMMSGYSTPVDPLLESVPPLDINSEVLLEWADAEVPEVERSWTESTDSGSGVSHYEYVVSTSDEVPPDEFDAPRVPTTEELNIIYSGEYESSLLKDFDTEIYFHVRAKDYAGNASEILTLGPLTANDPTSPIGGKIQAKVDPYEVKLYLIELPYDPESDLKGIQYSLGTSPGATNLRGWPEGDNVDFDWGSEQNGDLYWQGLSYNDQERFVTIPGSQLPPEGDMFYINYRVVNGQGNKSGVRATGPIILDESRPLVPSVDLMYFTEDEQLQIELDGLEDPESGITSVEYSVYERYGQQQQLIPWTSIQEYTGRKSGRFSLSKTLNVAGASMGANNSDIAIRITNGAGMQRIISKTLSSIDINFQLDPDDFKYDWDLPDNFVPPILNF